MYVEGKKKRLSRRNRSIFEIFWRYVIEEKHKYFRNICGREFEEVGNAEMANRRPYVWTLDKNLE